MNRTIIIGDIHGMKKELEQLLAKLEVSADDVLILAGDLLDKGPDSALVVKHLRGLREKGIPLVLVQGNHEARHAKFRKAKAAGNAKITMKGVDELEAITAGLDADDVAFLETAVFFHRIPEQNAVVIHGGIVPAIKDLNNLSPSDQSCLLRTRFVTGESRTKVNLEVEISGDFATEEEILAAIRHQQATLKISKATSKPAGEYLQLGFERDGDPFWAEIYDGRFGHAFFGHNPFTGSEPKQFPHATGLDLGCVFGGCLAAAVLVSGEATTFVTVQASQSFATSIHED